MFGRTLRFGWLWRIAGLSDGNQLNGCLPVPGIRAPVEGPDDFSLDQPYLSHFATRKTSVDRAADAVCLERRARRGDLLTRRHRKLPAGRRAFVIWVDKIRRRKFD